MAGHLVRNLEQANQDVPNDLMELALKSAWFRNSRFRKGKGGSSSNHEKIGLGYKPPGGGGGQARNDNAALDDYLTSKDPVTSGSGASGGSSGGMSRVSAMKMAFKSQYMSRFQKAESADGSSTNTIQQQQQSNSQPSSSSNPEGATRKRKSRWE